MRLSEQLPGYIALAEQWLASVAPHLTRETIATGRDAWTVAHRAGITQAAYNEGRDVVDAHIQTALERVFPNAVFRDAKRY